MIEEKILYITIEESDLYKILLKTDAEVLYQQYGYKIMRYSLKDITEILGGVRALDTVEFDLIQNDAGHAVFINRKDEWQDWSDTSVCENIILKREKVENE